MTLASTDYNDGFGQERKSRPDRGRATRYKLTVLAADAIDAVTAAGGLVFDRARSGWEVDVYLAELSDGRALQILGVDARELLPDALAAPTEWPDGLMISGGLYTANSNVCRFFKAASRNRPTEVALWGARWPTELASGVGRVEHQLSIAARAFKTHSMAAAGVAQPCVGAAETFYAGAYRCSVAAPLRPMAR